MLFKAPLYANVPAPLTSYWPVPHNITQYSIEMSELVAAGNRLWDFMVPATVQKLPGAKAALFNSHQLVRLFLRLIRTFIYKIHLVALVSSQISSTTHLNSLTEASR